jgi:hypothetical protein
LFLYVVAPIVVVILLLFPQFCYGTGDRDRDMDWEQIVQDTRDIYLDYTHVIILIIIIGWSYFPI